MQINNIKSPNFTSVVRVSSNTQHLETHKVDSCTKQILKTWSQNSEIYQNEEVSRKIGDFLRAQLGVDINKGVSPNMPVNEMRIKCFGQNNCYCFTGKDAQRFDSIQEQIKKEKAALNEKYGLDKTSINELEKSQRKTYTKELLGIEAKNNARAMALLKNQSQLILDIDEKTGDINSINYLSISENEDGTYKWTSKSLNKEEIYK